MKRTLLAFWLALTVSPLWAAEPVPIPKAPVADAPASDALEEATLAILRDDSLTAAEQQAEIAALIEIEEQRKRKPPGPIGIQEPPAELATHGLHWLEVTGLDDPTGADLNVYPPAGITVFLANRPDKPMSLGIHAEQPGTRQVTIVATVDGQHAIARVEIVVGGGDPEPDPDPDPDPNPDPDPDPPPKEIAIVVVREADDRSFQSSKVEQAIHQYAAQQGIPLRTWDEEQKEAESGQPPELLPRILAAAKAAGVTPPLIAMCDEDFATVFTVEARPGTIAEAVAVIKKYEEK